MPINIILPAAGLGVRTGSIQPKIGSIFVDNKALYEKQITAIRQIYSDVNIFYVTGYKNDAINKPLKKLGVNVIYNSEYDNSNVAYSINLAAKEIQDDFLIILGDLYFDRYLLKKLPKNNEKSFLVLNKAYDFSDREIGINLDNQTWDYSFPDKWSQIAYINKENSKQFKQISDSSGAKFRYCFEILQDMMSEGTPFDFIGISGCLIEIDRAKDIKQVNQDIIRKKDGKCSN